MFNFLPFFKKDKKKEKNILLNKHIAFIHIPKNGGTSIMKAFDFKTNSHIKAKEILISYKAVQFKNCYSFGVTRNPYERFISLYNYAKMEISYYHNNLNPEKAIFGKHLDFEILKNASIEECAALLLEGKLRHDKYYNHWHPQYTWLFDEKGEKCLVDKIYRIEYIKELENDMMKIFNKHISVPRLNESLNSSKVVLNSKTKSIIQNYYHKDFEFFGYKK